MMKTRENCVLVISFLWALLLTGLVADAVPYDYSATLEASLISSSNRNSIFIG
ncbi:hypothetical protein Tsubulata_029501 [Turnera subulata]|uniref:Uncharacterized protein n=1 Tax=Turnera subulata TaxID=218843 RepID=A0A9Q0FHF9_9ROSI|nr:hypothetical protein Tsubulata_029501 [Turnera subulata]